MSGSSISAFLSQLYGRSSRSVFSVSVTGGGVQALQWIFSTPGASRCVQDGSVPYSRSSMDCYLGPSAPTPPISYASAEAAALMSNAARNKALQSLLADSGDLGAMVDSRIFGVACTAALVSTTPKKGPHRCHVAVTGSRQTRIYSLTLEKGLRSREGEDEVCSRLILDAIAAASDEASDSDSDSASASCPELRFCGEALSANEKVESSVVNRVPAGSDLCLSMLERVRTGAVGQAIFVPRNTPPGDLQALDACAVVEQDLQLPPGTLVFPGSFNPLHAAHVELLQVAIKRQQAKRRSLAGRDGAGDEAGQLVQCPVVFEIAAVNVDKPPLGQEDLASRVLGILHSPLLTAAGIRNFGVSITSEPLFVRKSRLFRGCTFVIGADTMARLVNPKYYYLRPPSQPASAMSPEESEASASAVTATSPSTSTLTTSASHAMVAALATIAERGCDFIVGGREQQQVVPEGAARRFDTLGDILRENRALLPDVVSGIFDGIDEDEFRRDMSSSDIRRTRKD